MASSTSPAAELRKAAAAEARSFRCIAPIAAAIERRAAFPDEHAVRALLLRSRLPVRSKRQQILDQIGDLVGCTGAPWVRRCRHPDGACGAELGRAVFVAELLVVPVVVVRIPRDGHEIAMTLDEAVRALGGVVWESGR